MKILVAGTDRELLASIEESLQTLDLEIVMATEARAILRLAQEHHPSLVLLDVTAPELDAYRVARRLRSSWRFGNPSILMLSSLELSSDWGKGLAAGADDFIVKPVDKAELVARVWATLQRLEEVRSASPLTGLPGNLQIQRELQRRVTEGEDVALLYADLDYFKAYNDRYGFLRGDQAILVLAEVLRGVAQGREDAFLGHVGGDDFIVLAKPDEAEEVAGEIVSGFEARVEELYDPEDAARGWIEIQDRRGNRRRLPLLTLSVGVATNRGREIDDHRRLVDLATEMKQFAKNRQGSGIAVDRRDPGDPRPARREGEGLLRDAFAGVAAEGRGPRLRRLLRGAAVAILALFVVVGPTTVVLAENAQPGELLWPVKLRIEDLRVVLERDPEKDVGLHLEFASRRLEELRPLLGRGEGPDVVQTVAENLIRHTEAAVDGLAAISPGASSGLAAQVATALARHVDLLSTLAERACDGGVGASSSACGGLRLALENSGRALGRVPGGPDRGRAGDQQTKSKDNEPPAKGKDKDKDKEPPAKGKGKEPPAKGKGKDKGKDNEPPAKGKDNEPPAKGKGNEPAGKGGGNQPRRKGAEQGRGDG